MSDYDLPLEMDRLEFIYKSYKAHNYSCEYQSEEFEQLIDQAKAAIELKAQLESERAETARLREALILVKDCDYDDERKIRDMAFFKDALTQLKEPNE